jgi:ARID/BRIGHT DNA binding domain
MLKSWFDTRSIGLRDIPKLNNRPVDLHTLFCETVAYGGNEKVRFSQFSSPFRLVSLHFIFKTIRNF